MNNDKAVTSIVGVIYGLMEDNAEAVGGYTENFALGAVGDEPAIIIELKDGRELVLRATAGYRGEE